MCWTAKLENITEIDMGECNSVDQTVKKNSQDRKHFQVSTLVIIMTWCTSGFLSLGSSRSVHKPMPNSKVLISVVKGKPVSEYIKYHFHKALELKKNPDSLLHTICSW